MELVQYIRLFRKWLWLILLCAVISGGFGYIRSSRQDQVYIARVTMVVGTYYVDPNPNASSMRVGIDLAQTYVHMATNHAVLEAAVEAGNIDMPPQFLAGSIRANVIEDTSLILISVSHGDPILAVTIADEVAKALIEKSPSNLTPEQQSQIDLANAEIERLREQLDLARVRLNDVENQLATATDPEDIARLTEQYDTVISQINQASSTISQFQNTVSQLQQRTNSLEIFEPARLVGITADNTTRNTILAVVVGTALAVGVALLIEYLDDSIRTPEQANQILGLPTFAAVPKFGGRNVSYPDSLITVRKPDSASAEEYRTLRTNLLYSMNGSKASYVVTSSAPAEGKTVTVANLAAAMATAGWRVLLIDSDLRRPRVHDVFGLDNHIGLSAMLSVMPDDVMNLGDELSGVSELNDCIKQTDLPGLRVITSGHIPLNPAEVLGSASMHRWFEFFKAAPDVDVVLFDTPPVLVSADAAVIASTIKAPVIMVLRAGRTKPGGVLRAKERLETLDITVRGTVLNGVLSRDLRYGGYTYYYYYKSFTPAEE